MESLGIATVGVITIIAYLVGLGIKNTSLDNKYIPTICGIVGGILGVVGMYTMPDFPATDVLTAIAVGIVSGLAATGIDQAVKQLTTNTNDEE